MHKLEEGILPPSEIYFLQPSEFAMETLYSLQHIGIFFCDERYTVTHPYWESILLLFIDRGELEVTFRDEHFLAKAGDIVMIDCRYPHHYHACKGLQFHYFHFNSPNSVNYVNQIYQLNNSACIRNGQSEVLSNIFSNLLRQAKSQDHQLLNEHRISVYIHLILCELVEKCSGVQPIASDAIEQAIDYMEKHITESISLDELADNVGLSKFYFNRYFKKHMGITPHQYFVNMRIQFAKRLLATTHNSVESIAEQCGFDTPSNFIRLFKQRTNMTPTAFRKIPF